MGPEAALRTHPRSSWREKERVARRLREARLADRISQDTFSQRLELAFSARTQNELEWLVADLPQPTWPVRAVTATVQAASRWSCQIAAAWRAPRTPRLLLPRQPRPLTLGRSRRCDCQIADRTVSRWHAKLEFTDGSWWLRDAGSRNGTWVNGWRVTEPVEVREGDEITLGRARYILV